MAKGLSLITHEALRDEVKRARSKFPDNDRLMLALMEEVGEVANAVLEGKDYQTEALQVAAVAMRIYEEGLAEVEGDQVAALQDRIDQAEGVI